MKKLALINFMLLLAVKSIGACETPPGVEAETQTLPTAIGEIIFVASYALIVPIVVLYFLRKRKGMWTIISGLVSLVLFFPIALFLSFSNMCDVNRGVWLVVSEFLFMLFLFGFQLTSWYKAQVKTKTSLP